ncbi:MAG: hypothetical protein HY644_03625 [Acidobacteria bacterium]|nr:hypothetical protein [Acidobacteriota bacterium]
MAPSARERALAENEHLKDKVVNLVMQVEFLEKHHAYMQQQKSVDTSLVTGKNWDRLEVWGHVIRVSKTYAPQGGLPCRLAMIRRTAPGR